MSSNLDKTRAALAEAEQRLARAEAEVVAKTAERDDLRERAGDEVLDNPGAAEATAAALARLSAAVDVAERTVIAARARVSAARPAVLRARAEALRVEAAELRAEAVKRRQRTDKLLAELAEFEGVPFGVAPAPSTTGIAAPPWYPFTRTQSMLARAAGLDEQAAELVKLAEAGSDEARAARVAVLVSA